MHPILKLVFQRLALGLLLLLAASALIFVGTQILPGDVAQSILGQSATPEALANLRKDLGLKACFEPLFQLAWRRSSRRPWHSSNQRSGHRHLYGQALGQHAFPCFLGRSCVCAALYFPWSIGCALQRSLA